MVTSEPKSKVEYFRTMLETGVAALFLDPRKPDVQVPLEFRGSPWMVLNYSHKFGLRDFEIDDGGVFASLSFNTRDFPCQVPWSAVFAVTNLARIWPEAAPTEFLGRGKDERPEVHEVTGGGVTTKPKRGHLRVVK